LCAPIRLESRKVLLYFDLTASIFFLESQNTKLIMTRAMIRAAIEAATAAV